MEGTVLCAANHAPLTPISFLERAALVYPDRPAIVAAKGHGHAAAPRPRTWRETRDRCLRLAAALAGLGVARRDVVSLRPLTSSPLPCSLLLPCYGALDLFGHYLPAAVQAFTFTAVAVLG
jgi:acyl-CoA synthetase (AMP-forming)/AMP-acid ligase II